MHSYTVKECLHIYICHPYHIKQTTYIHQLRRYINSLEYQPGSPGELQQKAPLRSIGQTPTEYEGKSNAKLIRSENLEKERWPSPMRTWWPKKNDMWKGNLFNRRLRIKKNYNQNRNGSDEVMEGRNQCINLHFNEHFSLPNRLIPRDAVRHQDAALVHNYQL